VPALFFAAKAGLLARVPLAAELALPRLPKALGQRATRPAAAQKFRRRFILDNY
jgi:hypothetical protein